MLSYACTAAKYEDDAGRYWDLFYKRNSDKFFKDRHYFDKEWPQLTQGQITVLEVRTHQHVSHCARQGWLPAKQSLLRKSPVCS